MSTPPEKLAASIGHLCQACGESIADIAVVNLRTAETDIQCYPCHIAMMTAVIAEVAASQPSDDDSDPTEQARRAVEAATAALAAD